LFWRWYFSRNCFQKRSKYENFTGDARTPSFDLLVAHFSSKLNRGLSGMSSSIRLCGFAISNNASSMLVFESMNCLNNLHNQRYAARATATLLEQRKKKN